VLGVPSSQAKVQKPYNIAILVLNYNGKIHLEVCIESILAQIGPEERLYLVDNGSTDGSDEYIRSHYPGVGLIRLERNLGYAEAYNRAVGMISEELVVFLNNDVEVAENWLAALKSQFERSGGLVAVCGSMLLFYHNRDLVNHAGGKISPIGGGIDIGFMKPDEGKERHPAFVGCVSGASMMVLRSVFLEVGGFDRDFFAYFEDVDFCWRAWLTGYRILFVPSSRVHHKLSSTMGPFLRPKRLFLGERNRLQSMLKNLEWKNLLAGLFVSVVYNLTRFLKFLGSGKPNAVLAVLRADLWVLGHLLIILQKRRRVQNRRRYSDSYLLRHGLLTTFTDGFREFSRLENLRSKH